MSLEILVGHVACEELAVDNECRGRVNVGRCSPRDIFFHVGEEFVGIEGFVEFGAVKPQLVCIDIEVFSAERLVVFEKQVVHFPEFTLFTGSEGGFGGEFRVGMERKRFIQEDKMDLAFVFFHDAVDGRFGGFAEWALEIAELYDCDGGVFGSLGVIAGGVDLDGRAVPGTI